MSERTPEYPPSPTLVGVLSLLHDGDDRCGCLRDALNLALDAAAKGWGDVEADVADIIGRCLSSHPAGRSARAKGYPSAVND